MEKNTYLVNIYLKIHNKQPLLMDDLAYLARYDAECFEKACRNVVYNIPETKPIMEAIVSEPKNFEPESVKGRNIEQILDNLKQLEINDLLMNDIDANKVKNLLGNLYMELLFPHNGKENFFDMAVSKNFSSFDENA